MLLNNITKSVEGADNLKIAVLVYGFEGDDGPQSVMTWRQARCLLAKPLCELYDACLRWVLDVDSLGWKVTNVEVTTNLEMLDRVRLRVCITASDGETASHQGQACLEEDTMPLAGGATFLCLSGTLQELEDDYLGALRLRERGEMP
jgi:hypothetical protein